MQFSIKTLFTFLTYSGIHLKAFQKPAGKIDWVIFVTVLGLILFSLVFVFSASAQKSFIKTGEFYSYLFNHGAKVVFGIATMIVFSRIDYHFWQRISKFVISLSVLLLLLIFVISVPINNVYRWLDLGIFTFQPSELAKFALIMHLSSLLTERQEVIKNFKYGMLPMLIWSGLICGLIAIQPNFSNAFITYILALFMLFIGNTNLNHLLATAGVSSIIAAIFAFSASYRVQRFVSFFGTSEDAANVERYTFQTRQAILAYGNGGLSGLGAGQSRQSNLFLPESFGDFILPIIGEEYGFIGVSIILLAFLVILVRGLKIVRNSPDEFAYLLSAGIVMTFTFYAAINAGVSCGILPNTGVPMPFISYGGTAIIIYSAAIGILLNISANTKDKLLNNKI